MASGTAISRWVAAQIRNGTATCIPYDSANEEPIPGAAIAEAAHQGDALAVEAYHRAGTYLGRALADILHAFNPDIVILGGGVSQSYNLFADALHESLQASVMSPHFLAGLQIVTAQLGDDAGLAGAYVLAKTRTTPHSQLTTLDSPLPTHH
jgi:glucokinase